MTDESKTAQPKITPHQPEPLGLEPTFGFGDRLDLATPGRLMSLRRAMSDFLPIFAQQSIREMTRTARTPEQVIGDALAGAREAGYTGRQGADADHLNTLQDVDVTAAAGFVFFTIDPSDYVDARADDYDAAELEELFRIVREQVPWIDEYPARRVPIAGGRTITLTEEAC